MWTSKKSTLYLICLQIIVIKSQRFYIKLKKKDCDNNEMDLDENNDYDDQQDSYDSRTTKHFLSPATTNRTEYESDFYFQQFYQEQIDQIPKSLSLLTSIKSSIFCEENVYQRTVAIIKPEFMQFKDVVLKKINDTGFSVIHWRFLHLTPEQVADFYIDHYGCPTFPNIIISMSLGPLFVLSLADLNAVNKWKLIIGDHKSIKSEWFLPFSIRSRFGLHLNDILEALHGSEDLYQANRENRYFFPESILEPIINEEELVKDYCNEFINPTLIKGLLELCRVKPTDPIFYLGEWLLLNNPFQPKLQKNIALTPT